MNVFLMLAFLFFIGSLFGWVLELFYRRFFSRANPGRKWINPGFLVGPYVPLYGFGLSLLCVLATAEALLPDWPPVIRKGLLFFLMAVAMTAIELLAGEIFIVGMKVKLWDYSGEWGNYKGIVCPKFSLFWALLGAGYYFLVHPHILEALAWLSRNLAFSFFIGFFFGVFLIDFVYSTGLLVKIRRVAKEYGVVVRLEEFKSQLVQLREKAAERRHFLLALATDNPLAEHLRRYIELNIAYHSQPGENVSSDSHHEQ